MWPVLLRFLASLIAEGAETITMEQFMNGVTKALGGEVRQLYTFAKGLNEGNWEYLKNRFGNNITSIFKKSLDETNLDNIKDSIPITPVNSSWIEWISWEPTMQMLSMKVKTGKKQTYNLPFFPRRSAIAMIGAVGGKNVSPGKTVWNYWKKFGKGSVANKLANKARYEGLQATLKKQSVYHIKFKPQLTVKSKLRKTQRIKSSFVKGTNAQQLKLDVVDIKRKTMKRVKFSIKI